MQVSSKQVVVETRRTVWQNAWWKQASFQILGLTLLGALLLLWDLGSKSFWTDELVDYTGITSTDLWGILQGKSSVSQPFLHHVIMKLWMSVFDNSEFSLRFISTIPVIGSIPFVYLLTQRFFGQKIALVATLLTVTSPGVVLFSRMMRYNGWLALAVVVSVYTYFLLLDGSRQNRVWVAYVLSSVGAAYLHYFGLLFLVGEGVLFLLLWKRSRPALWRGMLAVVTIALLYLPWIIVILSRPKSTAGSEAVEDPSISFGLSGFIFRFGYPLYVFIFGETIIPTHFWLVVPGMLAYLALTVLLVIYLFKSKGWSRERQNVFAISLLLFFGLFIAAMATSTFIKDQTIGGAAKRVMFLAPLFYILFSVGLVRLKTRYMVALLAVPLLLNGVSLFNYYTNRDFINPNYITPWREIVTSIKQDVAIAPGSYEVWTGDHAIVFYGGDNFNTLEMTPVALSDSAWQDHLDKTLANPPQQIVVIWRDRGERLTVDRADHAIELLKTKYQMVTIRNYIERDATERSFQKLILKRDVPEYYITVYRFQLK